MFIAQKIAFQPIAYASPVEDKNKRLALTTFKTISSGYHINKASFEQALQKAFEKLEDKNSPHHLRDQFLYGAFKTLFLKKKSAFYNSVYLKVNDFYKYHPFNLEGILSTTMSRFFQNYTFKKIIEHPTEKEKWIAILSDANAQEKLAEQVFVGKLLQYLQNEMNDQIPAKYKTFNQIIRGALYTRIEPMLKALGVTSNSRSRLKKWVNNFNYESALSFQGQNIYDVFFNEKAPLQRTNISQEDFANNQLKTYLDQGLDVVAKQPMLQTVLYYLFNDLLSSKEIIANSKGTLKDARSLIESIEKNGPLTKKLEIFFPNIGSIIQKFNLYWKSPGDSDGLVVVQQSNETPWLKAKNASGTEFDFKLRFKFLSNFIPDSEEEKSDEHNAFTIHIESTLPIYDQAKIIVNDFISKIHWNSGFRNSSLWTEKDIVKWISSIKNYKDIINAQNSPNPLILSFDEWSHFSSNDLARIDFSSLVDPNYQFEIKPLVKFIENSNNKLGNIEVYLRLSQISKNAPLNAIDRTVEIKTEDILVKSSSRILSMIELIQNLLQRAFPEGLNFNKWRLQKKSFWLNEFLDKNNNVVAFEKFESSIAIKAKQELEKRSNVIEIRNYLQPLLYEINIYRNDFNQEDFFSISPPKRLGGTGGFAIKKADPIDSIVSIKLNVLDSSTNEQINYNAEKEIKKMKVFAQLFKGPFKGTKGLDRLFIDKLRHATPLHPQVQPPPSVGSMPPPGFTFNLDNNRITIDDIKKTLESYGFENVHYSKVEIRWQENEETDYIGHYTTVRYAITYYDFSTGKTESKWHDFPLSLNFNHVPAEEIQKGYDNIINNLTDKQKKSKELLTKINGLFATLKDFETKDLPALLNDLKTKEWRGDVERLEYRSVIKNVRELIANHKYQDEEDILLKLEEIYDGQVPRKILDKLDDPDYLNVLKEILDEADSFSQKDLKRILENDGFLKFLKSQKFDGMRRAIREFLKLTNKTKYAYLGSGIGLGMSGVVASGVSIRWMMLNAKTKRISTKFKGNKYISIISLGAAIISIGASVVLTLLFFITKGGF